jgi:hypothetical protein
MRRHLSPRPSCGATGSLRESPTIATSTSVRPRAPVESAVHANSKFASEIDRLEFHDNIMENTAVHLERNRRLPFVTQQRGFSAVLQTGENGRISSEAKG